MRLDCLLLLFPLSISIVFGENTLTATFRLHRNLEARFKRQAGNAQSGGDSSQATSWLCSVQCFGIVGSEIGTQIREAFETAFSTAKTVANDYVNEQQRLERSCTAYNQMKDCMRSCPPSGATKFASSMYESMDYICGQNLRQWSQNIPCYRDVEKQVGANCSQQCAQNIQSMAFSSVEKFLDSLLQRSCKFVQCYSDCERPYIQQRCGQQAVNLVQGFISRSTNSVLRIMDDTQAQSSISGNQNRNQYGGDNTVGVSASGNIPDACRSLIQGSFYSGPSANFFSVGKK